MLTAAFAVLAAAVLFGAALAVRFLRGAPATAVPWPAAALHGIVGIAGLGCLILALRGPPRGLDQGTASFGAIAATLLALAALAGLGILLMHRGKRRRAGTLIGLHATLAISGFVVLAAYLMA
jgi:hypothetical protein